MEVKEAIEFLENRYDYKPHRNSAYIISKYNEAIGVVCKNIEQGEKYRQMWGELEHALTDSEDYNEFSWSPKAREIMKDIEEKHFPKE